MMKTQKNSPGTRLLLTVGIIAGPLYVIVGIIEGITRPGFNFLRHDLSVLANGDWGWVHSILLIVTGLMTVLAAWAMRRFVASGPGRRAPWFLMVYGLGLVGAGIFNADPARGFPLGTPMDANTVSWHGGLHLLFGTIGFVGLITACLLLAKRFRATGDKEWATFSKVVGIYYLVTFFGIAMGSNGPEGVVATVIVLFSIAVVLGWVCIALVSRRFLNEVSGT